jgi:hypothetical protein
MAEPKDQTPAILTVVRSFFAALNTQRWSDLSNYFLPGGYAALRRNTDDLLHVSLADFPGRIEKIANSKFAGKTFEETFENPVVHVDEDLAVVWANFKLLVEGAVVARGSNVFVLHRMVDGGWKISGLADRNVGVS